MADAKTLKSLEKKLGWGTWVFTAIHVAWYWYYLRTDYTEGSFWSFSDWWGFCKTLPGAITIIVSFAFSIAQCVVMFKTPDDPTKVYKREPKGDTPKETE